MAQAATSFHLFPDLPTELRLAIWRECLPRRVLELDRPIPHLALRAWHDDGDLPICSMEHTTKANSVPPLISRVCHEARSVALEKGRPLPDPDETTMLGTWRSGQWLDPARDTVHLHFSVWYMNSIPDTGNERFLPHFLEVAQEAAGTSVQQDLLAIPLPRQWQLQDRLETTRDLLVCSEIVCLHVDLQPALDSGLFASDKRIAMVGAWDHARIAEFRRLWERHGSRQDFRTAHFFDTYTDDNSGIDSSSTASYLDKRWVEKRWVDEDVAVRCRYDYYEVFERENDEGYINPGLWLLTYRPDHPWVADVLSRKPSFHPTIMMRLCTQPCYAGVSEAPWSEFEWGMLTWRL